VHSRETTLVSAAGSINSRGWATGQSETSTIDPVLGVPEFRGVPWKEGRIIDLGTLASGTESLGIYVNDAGQVIGFSTISTEHRDPVGFIGFPTHTFIWQNGKKLDIGTLGGRMPFPVLVAVTRHGESSQEVQRQVQL
jgi:probable HAF family extracellular repeat protein